MRSEPHQLNVIEELAPQEVPEHFRPGPSQGIEPRCVCLKGFQRLDVYVEIPQSDVSAMTLPARVVLVFKLIQMEARQRREC